MSWILADLSCLDVCCLSVLVSSVMGLIVLFVKGLQSLVGICKVFKGLGKKKQFLNAKQCCYWQTTEALCCLCTSGIIQWKIQKLKFVDVFSFIGLQRTRENPGVATYIRTWSFFLCLALECVQHTTLCKFHRHLCGLRTLVHCCLSYFFFSFLSSISFNNPFIIGGDVAICSGSDLITKNTPNRIETSVY